MTATVVRPCTGERHAKASSDEAQMTDHMEPDEPCTQADRDAVRAAAMTRAARMRRIADRLDEEADKLKWHDHALYFTCLDAADELRVLASGV